MRAQSLFKALMCCYPAAFRHEYGQEMTLLFSEQLHDARRDRSLIREVALWTSALADLLTVAPKEHWHVISQDVRYTLRAMAASPGFTAVAILSLALGIGANTAIYSLWDGVVNAAIAAREPSQLVILTDPTAAGVSIGSQTGERTLLTNSEFEQLRDQSTAFTSLMAAQSSLDRWDLRVGNGDWEEVHGRLVSSTYFDMLGVVPALGRFFTSTDAQPPSAVISYRYWQRRFAGRPDIVGTAGAIRNAALTIVAVAPPEFVGETTGQQPDIWIPLAMQAAILPGRDWLHDKGSDKVMWLHVFGRLRPGITAAQAQENANAVFRAGLETFYGSVADPVARRSFLDQRLRARPAATGASDVRGSLSNRLQFLLAGVGVLLLIACANIANLLLARGAARQREIALRLSLGASRARLMRQLLTESVVLAAAGGVAGLAAAYFLHRVLVWLIAQTDRQFAIDFVLEPRVLAFSVAATVCSVLLFGMLPAWLATRTDAGSALKGEGRSTTGSAGQLRWGRLLVVAQLGLSVPLLVGAGLLARTLYNLQNVNLGFPREGVLTVRVDAQTAGYELNRREPLARQLADDFRRVPGVRAVTYSENGILSGRDSADEIEVEGYTRTGKGDRGARWDQVGPAYFATLGIPMLLGREITDSDHAGAPKVCVINEAFAKLFFANRNPIGMRITTVYGDSRKVHQIVGVAANARTDSFRRETRARYYVPITQPLGEFDGVFFSIRISGDPARVAGGLRQAIRRIDPSLPLIDPETVDDRVNRRNAQDRVMAGLAGAFGLFAIGLAAIGLYGVLAYGTARRRTEIGIRIALGAHPTRVVRMILLETSGVLIAGLLVGALLAVAASRWIASQLYGLTPNDPPSILLATTLLILVAAGAAYLPARRASRMDPMAALRQE